MREKHRRARVGCALSLAILLAPTAMPGTAQSEQPEETVYRVAGIGAAAEIRVDRWGVPHLYAGDLDDLFFVQGFNAARDRLFQLDLWKRRGDGTLAEVLGPHLVDKDRAARLLLYRGDLYSEWLAYASDTKRIVEAFVAGINAYIDLTAERTELLPPEFDILGYRPAHWQPETVVGIRSHGLLRNLRGEVERARFLRDFGSHPELPLALELRYRFEPEHTLQLPQGLELEHFPDDVLRDYRLGTGGVSFEAEVLGDELRRRVAAARAVPAPGELESSSADLLGQLGSNNWAVAPGRSATGRALLADDPHRALQLPSLRYIAHLAMPGLEVIGAGEPALPGVSIGHNGRIAFGLTIFGIDQEDLYIYETHAENPMLYRYGEHWLPMTEVRERIAVKDAAPVEVSLRFTRHGPVLYEDREHHRAYALRAAWLEPGMAPYLGSIEYMRAGDWDGFIAALNRWGSPSENQVYADTSGNIGWKPAGRTPRRPNWDGLVPVPGDGRYEWQGFRDMDELPVEHNPERGWVATANQMNLPPGFDRPTGYEWAPPYRYQRIAEVLSAAQSFGLHDALELQADFTSIPARRLITVLERNRSRLTGNRVTRAVELLTAWDARLLSSSASAALFEVWYRRHLGRTLVAEVIDDAGLARAVGQGQAETILRWLESSDSRLGADPEGATRRILETSLDGAVAEVEELLGADWSNWSWGRLHVAEPRHPLTPLLDARQQERFAIDPLPRGGSRDTVGATGYGGRHYRQTAGASFRIIVDVGNWDASLAMNSPGQSGDPRSPHYRDLFGEWAADRAFPLLFSRQAVVEATTQLIRLLPHEADTETATAVREAGAEGAQ